MAASYHWIQLWNLSVLGVSSRDKTFNEQCGQWFRIAMPQSSAIERSPLV
jgi:hypothetical protein